MHVTITVKLQAQSKEELSSVFPGMVKKYHRYMESELAKGAFGAPADVELRFLVIGQSWRESNGGGE